MMLVLVVVSPLLQAQVQSLGLGAAMLSPNPDTSLLAALGVGLLVGARLVLYGIGPGWLVTYVLRQAVR